MDHSVKNQTTIWEGLFLDSLFYSIALFSNMPVYTLLIAAAAAAAAKSLQSCLTLYL